MPHNLSVMEEERGRGGGGEGGEGEGGWRGGDISSHLISSLPWIVGIVEDDAIVTR